MSLECQAEGIPEPAVTWLKDGRALGSDRDVAVLAGGRVLRLERARVTHTGRYVCVATNAAGLADSKYDLSVHGEWGPPGPRGQSPLGGQAMLWSSVHLLDLLQGCSSVCGVRRSPNPTREYFKIVALFLLISIYPELLHCPR